MRLVRAAASVEPADRAVWGYVREVHGMHLDVSDRARVCVIDHMRSCAACRVPCAACLRVCGLHAVFITSHIKSVNVIIISYPNGFRWVWSAHRLPLRDARIIVDAFIDGALEQCVFLVILK